MQPCNDHRENHGRDLRSESSRHVADPVEKLTMTRRETLRRAVRIAYLAPTVMVFSMSALAQKGPAGSPPPPPFSDPSRKPPW